MATTLFFRTVQATTHRGTNTARLDGTNVGWMPKALATTRGGGVFQIDTNTVAGTTNGVEINDGNQYEWLSEPLDADVTISGAITLNVYAWENNMSANVAINFVVDKVSTVDGAITQIHKSTRTTELSTTATTLVNFNQTPGAGVACNKGDRLRVRIFGDDAGTMASGFVFSTAINGTTGGANGDSFITFTENFGALAAPAGSQIFLTDTASSVDPGSSVEKEAWTTRGGSSVNSITNTATGWTAPIQVTASAGGSTIEWYTKQLTAFTLAGLCRFNIRALQSNAAANASIKAEVATTASDGTSPTVVGVACVSPTASEISGELTTSDIAWTADVGVDDTSITDGQRLRFRVYVDDSSVVALVTGHTVTVSYNGASASAAGDTYVTLPQTVTEFAVVYVPRHGFIDHANPGIL